MTMFVFSFVPPFAFSSSKTVDRLREAIALRYLSSGRSVRDEYWINDHLVDSSHCFHTSCLIFRPVIWRLYLLIRLHPKQTTIKPYHIYGSDIRFQAGILHKNNDGMMSDGIFCIQEFIKTLELGSSSWNLFRYSSNFAVFRICSIVEIWKETKPCESALILLRFVISSEY